MPPLNVDVNFRSYEFQSGLDLPVEVRRPNMSLVAAGLTRQPIDVPEGDYFVLARLPAGQQLISKVSVKAEGGSVQLSPRVDEQSPHENHETIHFMSDVPKLLARSAGVATSSVTATWEFALADDFSVHAAGNSAFPQPEPVGDLIRYSFGGSDRQRYLMISNRKTGKRVAVAVVASEGQYFHVLLPKAVTTARITPEIMLQNVQANFLLASIRKGSLQQADLASRSNGINAERLLLEKVQDPFAACVGAYTILIMGELERLHDWTRNLQGLFPWLSDGLVIRGEHLARIGRHEDALACFAKVPNTGVPNFAMGIAIAANRLRQYRAIFINDAQVQSTIEKAEEYLTPVAQFINPGQPVTTSLEHPYNEENYNRQTAVAVN